MTGRVVARIGRTSLVPLLLRASAGLAGYAALLLAAPDWAWSAPVVAALALVAALPAVLPHSNAPLLVIAAAGAGWVLSADPATAQPVSFAARTVALATLLYLVHNLSALAAALPYDAVVAPDAVARWLLRAVAVVTAAAALAGLVLLGVPRLVAAAGAVHVTHVGATLAGLALAVALLLLLRRFRA